MMKSFFKKLNSQKGASFILALLFFLICSMVSSSILMSSVSNAGKINSNKDEHQKYLILSSAVKLICDDLNNSYYKGSYTYTEEFIDDDTPYELKKITQKQGTYSGKLSNTVLKDFDSIFANEIEANLPAGVIAEGLRKTTITPHTLEIKTQSGTDIDESTVEVSLKVVESYAIEMTASLDDYKISAEITPKTTKPTIPENLTPGDNLTSPMEWKIGWITVDGYE